LEPKEVEEVEGGVGFAPGLFIGTELDEVI
jgi:hypothetical protein